MDAEWSDHQRRSFGQRLRAARDDLGESQERIGALFDVPKQTVSAWETGRNMPSLEVAAALADRLKVSLEWLALGRGPWSRFTPETVSALDALDEDMVRRAENQVRTLLDMPTLPPSKRQERTA